MAKQQGEREERAGHAPAAARPRSRVRCRQSSNAPETAAGEGDAERYVPDPERGLLLVRPYPFTYAAHAKGRWLGRSILDVFAREFQDHTEVYYCTQREAILQGRILLNGQPCSPEDVYRNGDVLSHTIHRHEPPVLLPSPSHAWVVPVTGPRAADMADIVAVNKPPSLPVHPTGRYRYNSLLEVMRWRHPEYFEGGRALHPVNRIDRLTSGLVLLSRSGEQAVVLQREFQAHTVHKTYVARVRGTFPPDQTIECSAPIHCVCHKLGVNVVDPVRGKPCHTSFRRLACDGVHSVVECRPRTGRTHQIRVHLQHLGFPIANDVLYGGEEWEVDAASEGTGEPERGRRMYTVEQLPGILERLSALYPHSPDPLPQPAAPAGREPQQETQEGEEDPLACLECAHPRPAPPLHRLSIWLHSWRYAGEGWSYETDPPPWASLGGDSGLVALPPPASGA